MRYGKILAICLFFLLDMTLSHALCPPAPSEGTKMGRVSGLDFCLLRADKKEKPYANGQKRESFSSLSSRQRARAKQKLFLAGN